MRLYGASRCVFAKLGPQTGEYTPGPSNICEVASSTVIVYACLVFVSASRAGCGGKRPRIAHSQNIGPQTGEYARRPTNIGEVFIPTVIVYACLMFVNPRNVRCGGGGPCIAYSLNWALKPASKPPVPPILAK